MARMISLLFPCFCSFILRITACDPADFIYKKKPSSGLSSPKRKESWLLFVSRCTYWGAFSFELQILLFTSLLLTGWSFFEWQNTFIYFLFCLQVDPFLSVSAAHCIGENVRQKVHTSHPEVSEVFIHIGTLLGTISFRISNFKLYLNWVLGLFSLVILVKWTHYQFQWCPL